MLGLIFGFFGYLFSNEQSFGGNILYALSIMQVWYYFVLIIMTIILTITTIIFLKIGADAGEKAAGKYGMIGGIFVGSVIGIIDAVGVLFKIGLQLYLINWCIDNILPTAVNLAALTQQQSFGLFTILIISLIPTGDWRNSAKKINNRG